MSSAARSLAGSAARGGYVAACNLLLDPSAAPSAEDKNGETALHRAAGSGYANACKLLLDRGAVLGAEDKKGFTALSIAEAKGHAEVQALLMNPRSARAS